MNKILKNTQAEYKKEAEDLIEKIYTFKKEKCGDMNIIDVMLEYSFKFDIPIQEIGNVLSEHKEFVEILEKQLREQNWIRDGKDHSDFEESEW